jgi:hypothetical protein
MPQLTVLRPPTAQGLAWIKQGWALFMRAPVPWAGMTALVFLVLMGLSSVPYVGEVVVHALSPFVVAGYLAASRAGLNGEPVTFAYLAAGFNQGRNSLFVIGLAYMLATLLIFRLVAFATGGDINVILVQIEQPHALSPDEAQSLLQQVLPALGLGALLMVPVLMATWFSPGLAHFEGFPPGKAAWWSLWACVINWRPLFVYSSLLGLLGIVAVVIPYGLGLLVFIPWTLTSTYVAYRDIFQGAEDVAAA